MNGELGPPARPEEPTQVGGLVPLLTATVPVPTEQVLAADPTMPDEPSLQQATELLSSRVDTATNIDSPATSSTEDAERASTVSHHPDFTSAAPAASQFLSKVR